MKGTTKFELILLFDKLEIEPKKMKKWLNERGQDYSYWTLKKYYGYWAIAKNIAQAMMKTEPVKFKKEVIK